jgi:hypothetical protein
MGRHLDTLNRLITDMQRELDINDPDHDRIDDEVIPLLMDASDVLARILNPDG